MHQVIIVGSGFAGLGLAIRLKKAGIHDFALFEKAPRLGGVWRDNVYPGVACDVESHLYSYSFEPNPRWTRQFAPQHEILAYLEHCAAKYGVLPHVRFSTAVESATFDEARGVWRVTTSDGAAHETRVLVSASGHALSKPVFPDIPGRETFAGTAFHSARWDHAQPLDGRTVAVVGTGASAIQIIPSIAPRVKQLHVFQRTPAWIVPRRNRNVTRLEQAAFARLPALQLAARDAIYWKRELMALGFVYAPKLLEAMRPLVLRHMYKSVKDPVLREKLTPRYTMGVKRVLPSDDFYPAMVRPNVELVTEGIAEIRPRGIVTSDGRERALDAIVFATGFEAADAPPPFRLVGRGGRAIEETWTDGIEAYYGCTVAGFPNLFLLVGPNTGLGHNSMVFMMESQFAYVLDALRAMRERGLAAVEVRPEVQARYNAELQARLAKTVWSSPQCATWYRNRQGRITTLWPGFTFEFRLRTRRFDVENYETVPAAAAQAVAV